MWLYVSPVLYYASDAPHKYRFLLDINPLGQLFTAWSEVLYLHHVPGVRTLAVCGAWALCTLVVGALFFMSRERDFAVRL
jgi:teichoic acid transport system permease protein